MSIAIMTAAWTAVGLTHTAKIVLLALADNANDAGVCWPSIPKVAERCALDQRSVYRAIAALEGGGHVTTESRPGKPTIYRVHPQTPDRESGVPLTRSHPTPDRLSPPPLTESQATPDTKSWVKTLPPSCSPSRALPLNLPPSPRKPSLRSGRAPKRARSRSVPDDFEVTEAMRTWAKTTCPNVDIDAETLKFRDHEYRDPHGNWPAAWRQWMRRSPEFARPTGGNGAATVPERTWRPPPDEDDHARK